MHRARSDVAVTVRRGAAKPRTVVVRTLGSEHELRYRDWVERNRAYIHKVSKGRVGFFTIDGTRRLLRCAPLHHHFQFAGVPGTRIVVRFWILSVLCAAAGLASLAVL